MPPHETGPVTHGDGVQAASDLAVRLVASRPHAAQLLDGSPRHPTRVRIERALSISTPAVQTHTTNSYDSVKLYGQ